VLAPVAAARKTRWRRILADDGADDAGGVQRAANRHVAAPGTAGKRKGCKHRKRRMGGARVSERTPPEAWAPGRGGVGGAVGWGQERACDSIQQWQAATMGRHRRRAAVAEGA